jgi:flagellar biosynthetic protein FliR
MRIRALLCIAIATLLTPMVFSRATPMPNDVLHLIVGLAGEFIIGFLLGSIVVLTLTSLQLAGQMLGNLAGFDIAVSLDPASSEEIPVISNLLGMLAVAILLIWGGHRHVIESAMESFARYPAGGVYFETYWLDELERMVRHTFEVGIRAAAPLAIALLLSNVVTSLLARTLPQLNILSVGFNINISTLFLVLLVSLGGLAWLFQTELAVWLDSCRRIATVDT